MNEENFVNGISAPLQQTLFEWREDVIRPKLMMEKIVRPKVQAALTDADLHEGFETRYGPKVDCRMIVFDQKIAPSKKWWPKRGRAGAAFLAVAEKQAIPNLASAKGQVPPIHKHFGDPRLEETAFRLKKVRSAD